MAFAYLFNKGKILKFVKVKLSRKGIRMSLRNVWYMCKLGGASFIGQSAVIILIICSNLFLKQGIASYEIASSGLPLFAIGFISFAINMMSIGYFQSIEKINKAMIIIILRGIIFLPLFFYLMPPYLEQKWRINRSACCRNSDKHLPDIYL